MQQLQPLGDKLDTEKCDSSDISARTIEAGYETRIDRIGRGREHDRDRLRRCHGRPNSDSDIARARTDHCNIAADKIGRCHARQASKLAFGPAVFDGNVTALNEACFAQAFVEPDHAVRPLRCRHAVQDADRRREESWVSFVPEPDVCASSFSWPPLTPES